MVEHVKPGSFFLARSQIFSPCTSLLDCFQNFTSQSSRSYHPFPTMPWSCGHLPVTYVDCTEVVTAGKTGVMVARLRLAAYFFIKGVKSPISFEERPTISMTTVFF